MIHPFRDIGFVDEKSLTEYREEAVLDVMMRKSTSGNVKTYELRWKGVVEKVYSYQEMELSKKGDQL